MRRLIALSLISCLFSFTSIGQARPKAEAETFRITEGTKLIYHVDAGEKQYDFIVMVKKLGPEVVFDYEITAPIDKKGTVTLKAQALKSATALSNYLSGGPVTLSKETSVFISKALYTKGIKNPTLNVVLDGKSEKFTKLVGMDSKISGNMYAPMTQVMPFKV